MLFYAKMNPCSVFFLLIVILILETFASFVIERKTIFRNLLIFENHEKRLLYFITDALHECPCESWRLDETSAGQSFCIPSFYSRNA